MHETLIYGLLWLSFGAVHSWLANQGVKQSLQRFAGSGYRLLYNIISVAHLGIVLALGRSLFGGSGALPLPSWLQTTQFGMTIMGVMIVIIALLQYDLGRFSGISQIRHKISASEAENPEPLLVTGIHEHLRHPLYLGVYFVLWGQIVDMYSLQTAIWGSVYLGIGTYFEERRLVTLYGDAYRDYQARVPSLVPKSLWSKKGSR